MQTVERTFEVPDHLADYRLDKALACLVPEYSRAKLVDWLNAGQILVEGKLWSAKSKVRGGEQVCIQATIEDLVESQPEAMALDVVFEDEHLLVVNKPANLVVHPAAGHHSGTLLNGLLHHCPSLDKLPRAGIVHRLDKDTTGLMVIAKTLPAHTALVRLLQDREIDRYYYALVQGYMIAGGTVETQYGRHPNNRLKMAVVREGKEAITHYKVARRFKEHSLLEVKLDTGRTHQIRVHMNHIKYPIIGDPLYAGRAKLPKGCDDNLRQILTEFPRQALHAYKLALTHPITQEQLVFHAPIPDDMKALIESLQAHEQSLIN